MREQDIIYPSRLVQQANTMGIKLSIDQDELIVKVPKHGPVDRAFLEKLKKNRDSLFQYVKNSNNAVGFNLCHPDLLAEIPTYYKVPKSHHWWLDEQKDVEVKRKIFMLLTYKINGNFNVSFFKKALSFVVHRHESLRAVFHFLGNDGYGMEILSPDSPKFELDYRDYSAVDRSDDGEFNNVFYFKDHEFDLKRGPLFLIRLLKISHDQYLLSSKLHHVIYDAWSIDILLRDLLTSFVAFSQNQVPDLPVLKVQYKDYMALMDNHADQYLKRDREYWKSITKTCPTELTIPGQNARVVKPSVNVCHTKCFLMPDHAVKILSSFVRKYSRSLFLILQTTINLYLHKITGSADILLATMVFGRDQFEDYENQIGLYSRMMLIRTHLDDGDSFEACLKKVCKSNDDMRFYTAESLLDTIEQEILANAKTPGTLMWRVAIQYGDWKGYTSSSTIDIQMPDYEFSLVQAEPQSNEVYTNIDLYLNFLREKDKISLNVTYATDLFAIEAVEGFVKNYFDFLTTISSEIKG